MAKQKAEQNEQPEQADAGPPQGIVVRHMETGTRADFHRNFYGRSGLPDVRRIDPASLAGRYLHPTLGVLESPDPWLRAPDGVVMQVRADHAAERLECNDNGDAPRWRIATQAEIDAAFESMKRNTR